MKISIVLEALTGAFETDTKRASKSFEKDMKRIEDNAVKAGKVVGAALVAGAAALVAIVQSQANAIAEFQDLSEKIGDTAENIASLKLAADVSGTAFDTIAAASVKLTAGLAKTEDETKGAGLALRALGIDFDSFVKLAPVEQLDAVARALAGFEDGSGKTAVAVQLLGKSGAELLPFLKSLAEGGERQIGLTNEQIRAADDYADSIAGLSSQFGSLVQKAVSELIPTLQKVVEGARELFKQLSDSGAITALIGSIGFLIQNLDTLAVYFASRLAFGVVVAGFTAMTSAATVTAGAVAGLNIVMGLLGGPVGLLALAATGVYLYATSETEAEKATKALKNAQDTLTGSTGQTRIAAIDAAIAIREESKAKLESAKASLLQAEAQAKAANITARGDASDPVDRRAQGLGQAFSDTRVQSRKRDLEELSAQIIKIDEAISDSFRKIAEGDTTKPALVFSATGDGSPKPTKPPKAPREARQAISEAERLIASLSEQLALYGDLSKAEEVRISIANGYYGVVTPAQAMELERLAGIIDANAQREAQERTLNDLAREAAGVYEATLEPAEKLAKEFERLNLLRNTLGVDGAPLLDAETYARAVTAAQDAFDAIGTSGVQTVTELSGLAEVMQRLREEAESASRTLLGDSVNAGLNATSDLLADLTTGSVSAGDALKNFARSFVASMARIATQALATIVVLNLLRAIPGGAAAVAALDASAPAVSGARANGGPVNAGEAYLVGERGPEIMIPRTAGNVMSNLEMQRKSAGQNSGSGIRIVNAFDTAVVGDYLGSSDGERAILNVVQRNGSKIRTAIGST